MAFFIKLKKEKSRIYKILITFYSILISIVVISAALFNVYSFYSPKYNRVFSIENLKSNEIVIRNEKNEDLFIVSPYQIFYKKENVLDVIFYPEKSISISTPISTIPSYNNTPSKISQVVSTTGSELKLDVDRSVAINEVRINEKINTNITGIEYYRVGLSLSDEFKIMQIEKQSDEVLVVYDLSSDFGYEIESNGMYEEFDEKFRMLLFKFDKNEVSFTLRRIKIDE